MSGTNNENLVLTIAIPTYNRPFHIVKQIRDILPQLVKGVCLKVHDNCSDVPVASYFTDEELSLFTITRNVTNIGSAINIAHCLETSESEWVWTLGDDDRVKNNAVQLILDVIGQHPNCCYINFGTKKDIETTGLGSFLDYIKIMGALGTSFFISSCLFNVRLLKPHMSWYYDFLSSWISQICLVIKYLEKSESGKCLFQKEEILQSVNVGGWSPLHLITNSSILVDKFYYCGKIMRPTLFKALADMYFTTLSNTKSSFADRLFYVHLINFKFGFFNVLRYNRVTAGGYVLSQLLPSSVYRFIRNKMASRYNSKV